jgi:hypothetical protein
MAYWNGSAWVDLDGPFQKDTVAYTISTTIYHFTPFTVIENTSPAAFAASNLTITPAEVNIGEATSITVTITNTGDLSGTYNVVLKVNGTDNATKAVTISGHKSQQVTFTLSQSTAGTYTISIGGLSGALTVKALPIPTPTATPTLTPKPTLTPTPTPTQPAAGLAWWYIVIIVVGIVIIGALIAFLIYRRRT